MSYRLLTLGVLALSLAACQSDDRADTTVTVDPSSESTAGTVDPATASGDVSTAGATDVTAQSTVDAVTAAGGLTALPAADAVANIDGWIAKLEGNAAAAPVVANLRTLKTQLTTTPLDGAAIGQTLTTLGQQTTTAAAGTGDQQASLEALGSALSQAGATLTGN